MIELIVIHLHRLRRNWSSDDGLWGIGHGSRVLYIDGLLKLGRLGWPWHHAFHHRHLLFLGFPCCLSHSLPAQEFNERGYELGFRISDATATSALIEQISSALMRDPLQELLDREQPDVVVCPYLLFLEPLSFVFDRTGEALPVVSVITDLVSVHTIWFNPRVDLCLVPTEQAREKALHNGMPADRVRVTGLPVHPRFGAETRPQDEIRAELGWKADIPLALIVGGTRVPNVPEIARLIDRAGLGRGRQFAGLDDLGVFPFLEDVSNVVNEALPEVPIFTGRGDKGSC